VVGVEGMGMIGGGADVEAAAAGETGLLADAVTGDGFIISTPDRAEAEAACTGDSEPSRLVSTVVLVAAFRPQNESRPPPAFFPLFGSDA
jgi:hypothetical protein